MKDVNPTPARPDKPDRTRLFEFLGAVALLALLAILLFDWNMLRRPIERRVTAASGREFHINGNLLVDLSTKPRITFERISLGNLPGAAEPVMASADSLQFRLHLMPLLHREVILSEVKVGNPHLLLEKNRQDQANWVFKSGKTRWPTINQLLVDQGDVIYRNPLKRTDMRFAVRSGAPSADARLAPLIIDGKGSYVGNALLVNGRIESPLVLKDPGKPYRIDLTASAGATHATAKGSLIGPLQMRGFDLEFGLRGPNMALLFPLIGVAVPDTPPYQLLGRLTRVEHTWHYDDFKGTVGDSDLAGNASIATGGPRPFLKADLVSRRLDFDDLAGFVGAPPQTKPGETASAEQRQEAASYQASDRVLPDHEFELDKLRRMDADVKLHAQRINAPSLPLEAMTAHLFVDDGVLRLDPLDFRAAGGEISSRIRLDARNKVIASSARVHASGLSLPKLFPRAKMTQDSTGRIGGSLDLKGNGNSIARMLATSGGKVDLTMGSGRISNLLMEYAGIDIAEALKFLLTKDRTVPVRCGFADFTVDGGVMTTKRLAFDTTDTVIFGEGTVNLQDERISLRLQPKPKDHSFFTLRAPLLASGTFKDPSFRPDMKRVTLRALAGAALATLAPPAALLAVYETGPGKNVACRGPDAGKDPGRKN